jgi:hypothetical protein
MCWLQSIPYIRHPATTLAGRMVLLSCWTGPHHWAPEGGLVDDEDDYSKEGIETDQRAAKCQSL